MHGEGLVNPVDIPDLHRVTRVADQVLGPAARIAVEWKRRTHLVHGARVTQAAFEHETRRVLVGQAGIAAIVTAEPRILRCPRVTEGRRPARQPSTTTWDFPGGLPRLLGTTGASRESVSDSRQNAACGLPYALPTYAPVGADLLRTRRTSLRLESEMLRLTRFRLAATAILACGVLAPGGLAAYAASSGPGTTPKSTGLRSSNAKNFTLTTLNTWIVDRASDFPGYVASIDHPATQSATILWHGDSIDSAPIAAEASKLGISLNVEKYRWSRSAIDAAAQTLASKSGWASKNGFVLSDVSGLNSKFQGITIRGHFRSSSSSEAADVEKTMVSEASNMVHMPVRIVGGSQATTFSYRKTSRRIAPNADVTYNRSNDFQPFNAGGLFHVPGDNPPDYCSSGFSLNIGNSVQILTARHCEGKNYTSYHVPQDGLNHRYGGTEDHPIGPGAARRLGGSGSTLAWTGIYNSGAERNVVGIRDLALGNLFCDDGGNSGYHCNIKVTDLSDYFNDGTGNGETEMIRGHQQTAGKIAGMLGDSGGPVDIRTGDGKSTDAVGMIQGSDGVQLDATKANCGSAWKYDYGEYAGSCSRTVVITSIRTIIGGVPGSSLHHG